MKKLFFVAILISTIACQKSDYREVKQYTIEQFVNTTRIFGSPFHWMKKTFYLPATSPVFITSIQCQSKRMKLGN